MKKKILLGIIGVIIASIISFVIVKNNSTSSRMSTTIKLNSLFHAQMTVCRNENENKTISDIVTLKSINGKIIFIEYKSYLEVENTKEDIEELKKIFELRNKNFNSLEGVSYTYESTDHFISESTSVNFTVGPFKELMEDPEKLKNMEGMDIDLTNYLFMINFKNRDLDVQIEKLERWNYVCE